jgi:hypothetical protein
VSIKPLRGLTGTERDAVGNEDDDSQRSAVTAPTERRAALSSTRPPTGTTGDD